jgi:hypothetical protein
MYYKISQGTGITSLSIVLSSADGNLIRRIPDICCVHFFVQTRIRVRTRVIFFAEPVV